MYIFIFITTYTFRAIIFHRLDVRAFRISAPTTWNSLPTNVRECSSLAIFRNHLKTHYFSSAFSAL